ncbi:phage tail protein, partial [Pseudomonas sp. MWU12-2115]|uniref:phage tail protein n=1 Tax=Pseudomonas sp. MWU12-2115 TaxID=2071713 RepID=UPI001C49953D
MTDAVPSILARDQRFGPLSRLTERVPELDLSVFLVNLIDTVQPDVLPLLAEQFHIHGEEGWTLAESDDARRALLHSANGLHRDKGTPWAIREAIRRLGLGEVTLIEGLAGQKQRPHPPQRLLRPRRPEQLEPLPGAVEPAHHQRPGRPAAPHAGAVRACALSTGQPGIP